MCAYCDDDENVSHHYLVIYHRFFYDSVYTEVNLSGLMSFNFILAFPF